MFTDIETFLRYFEGVHRRAVRDIGSLPLEAESYRPQTGEGEPSTTRPEGAAQGERAWSIGELVRHMAGSRLYFARAYRGEGWVFDFPLRETESQEDWLPCLEESMTEFRKRLEDTPPEWLSRKVQMIDSDGTLSGWRILMMCLEHDVHHRSQIETYAGLQGWPVQDIYGRSAEQVGAQRERQLRLHRRGDSDSRRPD